MSYNYNQGATPPPPPPGGPAGSMMSQAGVQDVVNSWISSLTKPNLQTMAAEVPRATQERLIVSLGLAAVISAVLGLIGGLLNHNLVGGFLGALIGTPIAFLIGTGIVYLIAKALGGQGTFMQQAWVHSTFWAPLLILGQIPILGAIVNLVGWIYSLYLLYLALQPVHRFDSTKALTVVGILFAIGLVLAVCAFFVLGAAMLGLAAAGAR